MSKIEWKDNELPEGFEPFDEDTWTNARIDLDEHDSILPMVNKS